MNAYRGTREAFSAALISIVERDGRAMLVSADSLKAMRATGFAERFPQRYIEVGIAEQNALNVAAGLASCTLIPFVATYAGFITMRACEQLRTFIAYPGLNVKMIGINGGLIGGEREGVTHQFYEDLGILRSIPGVTILTPADEHQVFGAVLAAMEIDGPVYIRCASGREPVVYEPDIPFTYGRNRILLDYGRDAAVFASGFIMDRAIAAAEELRAQGILVRLIDVSTLKPLDWDGVTASLTLCGAAVTAEDHNRIGGLGSAVCEVAAERCPVPVERVGLEDVFGQSGFPDELISRYRLDTPDIVAAVQKAVRRKEASR